jgi:hypothetical protein
MLARDADLRSRVVATSTRPCSSLSPFSFGVGEAIAGAVALDDVAAVGEAIERRRD